MQKPEKDKTVLRTLAEQVAGVAALPQQEEKRRLWRRLNGLKPERPMVMIAQVCWNELAADDLLALECGDAECRQYEQRLRRTLYQWEHFAVDMVVEPYLTVEKAVSGTGFGVETLADVAITDPTNAVRGQHYQNQFETDADLEKIKEPLVVHDAAETARREAVAHEIFDGVMEVRTAGVDPSYMSLWDPISHWMSVEGALYAVADRPDFVHAMLDRMTRGYLSMLDQLEEQNLLCGTQPLIHCTGAYTDELPGTAHDPQHPRTKDLWCMGLAQMFSTVSPAMFDEFEVAYVSRLAERFGLVYYGCCDPLDLKMAQVRKIPKVRKVSMSPWTSQGRGASELRGDYVFSRKPNPAFLARDIFREDEVRTDLQETVDVCKQHKCPLEIILKDISTIRYEPQRLERWAQIAMETVG